MRPGSTRLLVLPVDPVDPVDPVVPVVPVAPEAKGAGAPGGVPAAPQAEGPVALVPDGSVRDERSGTVRRYRLEAVAVGTATVRWGETQWRIEVRGVARPAEQTRDDTDEGWGGAAGSGHSGTWWEEQRPPHW